MSNYSSLRGLHIIKNPAGSFSYVGSIPASLGTETPASPPDVMGGRAFKNKSGELVTLQFPVFQTRGDAILFATLHGEQVVTP